MPSPDAELFRSQRTMGFGPTGTIVLSSAYRLLFIDRKAIDLLSLLDSDSPARRRAQLLPTCIMTLAQEIVASHSPIDTSLQRTGVPLRRLIGSPAQPIRVQGFTVPYPQRQDMRIVLVLSQSDGTITQDSENRMV